jgi:monoamine oxidase
MAEKILIIGAGVAGLMAGRLLAKHGYEVMILEARERIGGRIFTERRNFSFPIERGAEFIHGDQPLTKELASDAGCKLIRMKGRWYEVNQGKKERADLFEGQWNEMLAKLDELEEDTDIASFLDRYFRADSYDELRKGVRKFVEGYDAADTHRVSSFALRKEWSETSKAEQYRIGGGYGQLINFLEKEFLGTGGKIHVSCEVNTIKWSKEDVSVQVRSGEIFGAEKVILTVPLGVLQNDGIHFVPGLPFNKEIFKSLGYGGVIKFAFEFTESFWQEKVMSRYKDVAFILSDAEVPTWWSQSPHEVPILVGWWGGPSTFNGDHRREVLYGKAVSSLEYILKCPASVVERDTVRCLLSDWVTDPYSLGAYGYATVNSTAKINTLAESVESVIFFAGEAIYEGDAMGTVEAALVSAKEVCDRVLSQVR